MVPTRHWPGKIATTGPPACSVICRGLRSAVAPGPGSGLRAGARPEHRQRLIDTSHSARHSVPSRATFRRLSSLSDDPVLDYALRELAWFEFTRRRSRLGHYGIEFGALVTSSVTVVAAGLQAPAGVTATIVGLAVFFGGLRQIFDQRGRYVLAAEAWGRLHPAIERYRLLSPGERDPDARSQLLERVEAVVDSEITSWSANLRQESSVESLGEPPQSGR